MPTFNKKVPDSSKKTGEGNANSSPVCKQVSPAKYWAFRLNYWEKKDIEELKNLDSSIVPTLVFQTEIGEKSKIPHIQGSLMFKTKGRPFGLGLCKRMHWEKKIKNSKVEQFFNYPCKDDTYDGVCRYLRNWKKIVPYKKEIKQLKIWQFCLLHLIKCEVNDRLIFWVWSKNGGLGKTTFQKWYFSNYSDAMVTGGKVADVKHSVANYLESNHGEYPRVVFVNICKSQIMRRRDYTNLETLKDMFFHSGKYEGKPINGPEPHLFVFANVPPDYDMMTERFIEMELN